MWLNGKTCLAAGSVGPAGLASPGAAEPWGLLAKKTSEICSYLRNNDKSAWWIGITLFQKQCCVPVRVPSASVRQSTDTLCFQTCWVPTVAFRVGSHRVCSASRNVKSHAWLAGFYRIPLRCSFCFWELY